MNVRDLIPWNRSREVTVRRGEEANPFVTLHRGNESAVRRCLPRIRPCTVRIRPRIRSTLGWPNIEVSETDKEVKVAAELPGLEEKDVEVQLANGVLVIKGEKKIETEDKDRLFSERYYGRFERRIPVEDIEEDKVTAAFRNGVLTVTMPKSAQAQRQMKRIAVNGG